MKVLLVSFLSFFWGPSNVSHDVPVAQFVLYQNEGLIKLDVTFDLDDYLKDTGTEKESISAKSLSVYLNKNTSWHINHKRFSVVVNSAEVRSGHLEVTCTLGNMPDKLLALEVKNSCLTSVPHQANNVFIRLAEEEKGYRMHKGRTSISVKF